MIESHKIPGKRNIPFADPHMAPCQIMTERIIVADFIGFDVPRFVRILIDGGSEILRMDERKRPTSREGSPIAISSRSISVT